MASENISSEARVLKAEQKMFWCSAFRFLLTGLFLYCSVSSASSTSLSLGASMLTFVLNSSGKIISEPEIVVPLSVSPLLQPGLSVSLTSSGVWIILSPMPGAYRTPISSSIVVSIDPTKLPASHLASGIVTLSISGYPTASFTVQTKILTVPKITFTDPAPNSRVSGQFVASALATPDLSAPIQNVSISLKNGSGCSGLQPSLQCIFDSSTLSDGIYALQADATDINGGHATAAISVTVSNNPIFVSAIADSASFSGLLAWGGFASIAGTQLSDGGTYQARSTPWPKKLGSTQVFAHHASGLEETLDLIYVSPSLINVRMSTQSWDSDGWAIVVSVDGKRSSFLPVPSFTNSWFPYAMVSPALFFAGFDCPFGSTSIPCGLSPTRKSDAQIGRAIVTDGNYSLVTNDAPARPGGTYVLWLTGLGYPTIEGDLRGTLYGLRVILQHNPLDYNVQAEGRIEYAGGSDALPGLYQINFTIPKNVAGACGPSRSDIEVQVWVNNPGSFPSAGVMNSNSLSIPVLTTATDNPCR